MISDPKDFGNIPIKPGRDVYVRDVATVSDSTDLNYGYALVNGHKSVYLPIVKKSTASTLLKDELSGSTAIASSPCSQ